ncbi:hypothetical protein H0H92_015624 [Tricholoma furcatifolium]|nr:hypothetical protein H0H92_015624 [Tricholoma furcatifolium]
MGNPSYEGGVFAQIHLPCGRRLENRLVKVSVMNEHCTPAERTLQVAMYEHLANFHGGPPNKYHFALYSNWAESGWGMIITGNVQVSSTHLSLGRDVTLPKDMSEENIQPFRRWSASIRGSKDVLAIMQLSHAGRQSTNIIGGRLPFKPPLAPSPIRVATKESGLLANALQAFAFQRPSAMSIEDIDTVVQAFIGGAILASKSGFDGIQLHAAHGYLLAQFISPKILKSNKRNDEYSSHPNNALRLLRRIVTGIRSNTPKGFVVGIKLNAADYADDGKDAFEHVLGHFKAISQWGEVDFIEVSGGDYEAPTFMTTQKACSARQTLFSEFSKAAMGALESSSSGNSPPLILLTGGLRTPELLHTALTLKHAHLLGIGRASVLCPDLPRILKQRKSIGVSDGIPDSCWSIPFRSEPDLNIWANIRGYLPTIVGAGMNMAWYVVAMRRLAANRLGTRNYKDAILLPDYTLGPKQLDRFGSQQI